MPDAPLVLAPVLAPVHAAVAGLALRALVSRWSAAVDATTCALLAVAAALCVRAAAGRGPPPAPAAWGGGASNAGAVALTVLLGGAGVALLMARTDRARAHPSGGIARGPIVLVAVALGVVAATEWGTMLALVGCLVVGVTLRP